MTSQNVGNIIYTVDVNTGKFISGMNSVDKGLDKLDDGFKKADSSGQAFGGGLTKIAAALGALATIDALRNLQKMSEEFTLLRARIDRFSGGVREGAENYERLLAISSKTGSDMGTATKTWEALTGSLKEMGKSNADILTLTDTLMKMGTLGGASAEEMKNGLRQLGQSFSGGIVRGEEFNSVLENTPEIARQLAKGLGIPFADLRKQMLDSKLTTEAVFTALLKRVDDVNADFSKMPRTVSQAANAITNEFGSALSKLDKESGFSASLAKAIDLVAGKIAAFGGDAQSVSDALDMIGNAASSFAAIMAGRVLTSLGGAAAAQLTAIKATMAAIEANKLAVSSELQRAESVKVGAMADLDRAKAAVVAAEASVAASREAQAAEIARMQSVLQALQAEKSLEAQRLKAQITDKGRTATVARMAEIQTAQAAITNNLAKAEASLAATTVSSSAAMTAALNSRAAASEAAAAATARVAAATTAMSSVTGGATLVMRGLSTAMSFLGGPTGVILLAAYALYEFAKSSRETKVDVDALNGSLDKLTFNQLAKASNDAGDDITKLNKQLSESMSELRTQTQRPWESDDGFAKRKTELQAEFDGIQQQIQARKDLQASIKTQQDQLAKEQINKGAPGSAAPVHKTAPADQTVIDNLKEQRSLANLAGEARARLAAEQKLSAGATAEEKKQVGDLAVEIYRLDTAKKEAKKDDKADAAQRKKDLAEQKKNTEENAEAIRDYAVSIGQAAMKGEDLARSQAQAKLNKFATPQDVKTMDDLAKAMFAVEQQQANMQLKNSLDPMANENAEFQLKLDNLKKLNDAKLLEDARYNELRLAAEMDHDEQVKALQEAAFIRQSEGNAFMMRSIDALGQATTSTITGLLSGTMNATDAMKNFASVILNEAVGSLVQMGVQAVKQALIQRSAAAAAAAANVAGVTAQVATQTALAAQAAYASTAAIPVVGPAAAPAAAALAGTQAAALGAPAVSAAAGGLAGGRLYGGDVAAGSMYAVNENGAPEIFNAANGKQYMMPNQRGEVVSNKNASGGGIINNIAITINQDGSGSTTGTSDAQTRALAENIKGIVVNQLLMENRQGGVLWDQNNGR